MKDKTKIYARHLLDATVEEGYVGDKGWAIFIKSRNSELGLVMVFNYQSSHYCLFPSIENTQWWQRKMAA